MSKVREFGDTCLSDERVHLPASPANASMAALDSQITRGSQLQYDYHSAHSSRKNDCISEECGDTIGQSMEVRDGDARDTRSAIRNLYYMQTIASVIFMQCSARHVEHMWRPRSLTRAACDVSSRHIVEPQLSVFGR